MFIDLPDENNCSLEQLLVILISKYSRLEKQLQKEKETNRWLQNLIENKNENLKI